MQFKALDILLDEVYSRACRKIVVKPNGTDGDDFSRLVRRWIRAMAYIEIMGNIKRQFASPITQGEFIQAHVAVLVKRGLQAAKIERVRLEAVDESGQSDAVGKKS